MSHCTTFEISFEDKRLLFRALRNAGLHPENRIWQSFGSELKKTLGIGGETIGKLLTGTDGDLHIVFIETEDGLKPFIESRTLSGEQLEYHGSLLLSRVQGSYLRCAVEEAVRQYRQAGISADFTENESHEGLHFVITLGQTGKSIAITNHSDGTVEELIQGIEGRSCVDASSVLEKILTRPERIKRTWQPEYNAMVEDRMVQVLRLPRS